MDKRSTHIESVINEVFSLYDRFGDADYIGEPVSQLEHMSQSAQLAITRGSDDEIVLAAFFHDIGHICVMQKAENSMGGYGVKSHEKIGADYIREKGFPERVARLIESHVQAKRYLTFKYPEYYEALSEASRKTLEFQGGKMTAEEANQFENADIFEESILMRRWDEEAKETEVPIIDIDDLKERARRVLNAN
ncbi:HD domain-containing protein [Chryseolinea sp. T2]|uniref:HD domain-containing protein n=1 Tax=Chryseolinea sp. T2 TaxID=3129255 RepID=UPI0030780077